MPIINFLNLFDGETLNDWKMTGKGSFAGLQRENALETQGGMGLLWYYRRKFKDFILELEWKTSCRVENQESLLGFQIQEMILMLQLDMDMKYKLMILHNQM